MKNVKQFLAIIMSGTLAVATIISMTGCSDQDVKQLATDASRMLQTSEEENVYVQMVKGGTPENYQNVTYGEAFDAFFADGKWNYFKGTQEEESKVVQDENTNTDTEKIKEYDVVEFTGGCTYRDKPVTALIQFTLSDDMKTFEATYCSFNDVPQISLIMYSLIDKAFESFGEQDNTKKDVEETTEEIKIVEEETTETPQTTEEETTDEFKSDYYILPGSDIRDISMYEVSNFSSWELRTAKNEIYARHGRKFKDPELQDYFDNMAWYHGTIAPDDFNEDMLNEIEKRNVAMLSSEINNIGHDMPIAEGDFTNGSSGPFTTVRVSNVTDSSFDFEMYKEGQLIFKHHTAQILSEGYAVYDGVNYYVTFSFDKGTMTISGVENLTDAKTLWNSNYLHTS